jgi:ubiquinone/menaquinone biosynthesis C-methylase UbiE
MTDVWSRLAGTFGSGPDYWDYFGLRLVERADISPGDRVLDVGCGPGACLFPAAERAGDGGRAVGIDICPHCVGEALSGIERRGLRETHITQMNAEGTGFRENSFDVALCGFVGWDHCFDFVLDRFTGPDTRSKEITRVLNTGGRVGISSFERQDDIEWMEETLGRYLPDLVRKILSRAGFKDIQIHRMQADFVSADEETWWRQMEQVGWRRYLKESDTMGPGALEQLKANVFRDLQRHKDGEGIHFTKWVFLAFATNQAVQVSQ